MRTVFTALFIFLISSPAFAFTRGPVSTSLDGWSINYVFKSPDGTLGYTNIKISTQDQISEQTTACQTDSPCGNAVYDNNGNLTDPGSMTTQIFVQNENDAESLADTKAAAKEEQWIAEIGQ